MKYMMTLLALVVAAATVSGQSAATNPLIGAWKVDSAQPGLYVFTKQHYSFSRVFLMHWEPWLSIGRSMLTALMS